MAWMVCACGLEVLPEEMQEAVPMPESLGTTIWAGFEENATKSVLQVDESVAHVLWKSGDKFIVLPMESETTSYNSCEFTTTADNVASAEFTSSSSLYSEAAFYCAFYPVSSFGSSINYTLNNTTYKGFQLTIPTTQQAVTGSFDPAANLSFAYADSYEGVTSLHFKNIVSLLKIKLTGAADKLSELKSIKVMLSGSPCAGPVVLYDYVSDPKLLVYESDKTDVTLTGSFSADKEYYVAVAPGSYTGITVNFVFENGIVTKSYNGHIDLNRSCIKNLGTFELSDTSDPDVILYEGTSPGSNYATLCIIPDGFKEEERDSFLELARQGMDFFFSVDPFKTYKDYFKVYFLWTPSVESGASITNGQGSSQTERNTAFGSKWGESSYSDMQADEEKVYGFVSSHCPEIILEEKTIKEVPVLLLINDTRYGGIAHISSNGQTYCMVPYISEGGTMTWKHPANVPSSNEPMETPTLNTLTDEEIAEAYGITTGTWLNILLHEFGGHSFGRLADEYWYNSYVTTQGNVSGHNYPVPYALNVSGWYDTDKLPWKDLLARKTVLLEQSAKYGRIGVFQGGDVSAFNRWRSEEISCMIDNRPYFSTWQRILIAQRIMSLAGVTFDLDAFLATDNPLDPVRDVVSPVIGPATKAAVPVMPMLPPPVLVDNSPHLSPVAIP